MYQIYAMGKRIKMLQCSTSKTKECASTLQLVDLEPTPLSGFYLGNKFWGGSIIKSECGQNAPYFVIICNNISVKCTTCTCILQVMHTLTPNIEIWSVKPKIVVTSMFITGQNFGEGGRSSPPLDWTLLVSWEKAFTSHFLIPGAILVMYASIQFWISHTLLDIFVRYMESWVNVSLGLELLLSLLPTKLY